MQIAVSSRSFHPLFSAGRMHLWDVPGEARVLGLPGVELHDAYLQPPGGGLRGLRRLLSPPSPAPPDRVYDYGLLRRVRQALDYYHVRPVAWGCDSALGVPDLLPRARAYIRLALRAARQLGAPVLCVTADGAILEDNPSPAVETLGMLVIDAEQAGVRLALEDSAPTADVDTMLGIIQGVNSPWLGACVSFGSLRAGHVEDDFERSAARAIHVRATSEAFDAQGEETSIPYAHRLGVLRSVRYTGAISIEYGGAGDPAEGVRQTHRLIRRYWA